MNVEESIGSGLEARVLAAVPAGSLVGGEVDERGEGEPIVVEDPATGAALRELPNAGEEVALAALEAACAVQREWAATPAARRRDLLRAAHEAMLGEAEELALLITLEMGKPLAEARGEVAYAAEYLRWYSEEATRIRGAYADHASGGGRVLTRRHAIGPCLLITPWNFPLAMATRKIGPALAAGCTAILKPAEQTPLSMLRMVEIFAAVGLPAGVLNVLTTGRPAAVTEALLGDGRIRKLSFTGSTAVGRKLLARCADGVVRCSMELGGYAPLLVFGDAGLETAVEGALLAKIRNGGESCVAANRIHVQAGIAAEFTAALAQRMAALRVDRGTEEGVELGPLIDAEASRRVGALIEEAVAGGARTLTGGAAIDGPGHFFAPTLLADLPVGARMLREEIFAPVAPVTTFVNEDEAIATANDTEYGLVAYLFTRDLERALRVSDRLDTGMVGLNQGVVANPMAPFGGIKQSGLGREGGSEGIEDYLTLKYIALAGAPGVPEMPLGAPAAPARAL